MKIPVPEKLGDDCLEEVNYSQCGDGNIQIGIVENLNIGQPLYDEKEALGIFYKSSMYSNQKNQDAIDLVASIENKILDLELNHVYRLTASFALKSTYKNPLRKRQIELSTENIKGLTSTENWKSTSYLQNALMANSITCTATFKVLSQDEQVYVVQFLALQETDANV